MIDIQPVSDRNKKLLIKYNLQKKWAKQITILSSNPRHPSLHIELLEPKDHGIYSFRIDKKFRALFIWRDDLHTLEILTITVHYN